MTTLSCPGHCRGDLPAGDRPRAVVLETVPGKGVPTFERNHKVHYLRLEAERVARRHGRARRSRERLIGAVMKSAPELWQEIQRTEVRPGTLTLWWLYQAGLAIKTPGGTIVVVDPYLSDAVLRTYQLPRNVPAPLDPAEVDADALLATHSHADHLDPDSITPFMSHARTQFVGPPMAVEKVLEAEVKAERAVRGGPRRRT